MASTSDTSRVDRCRPIWEQPESPFLQLPGEIRSRICEYVLTTEHYCLLFVPGSSYEVNLSGPVEKSYFEIHTDNRLGHNLEREFNKLKYVCRQMYDETSCLEFSLNRLVFQGAAIEQSRAWSPARAFAEFLIECSPSKAARISDVELVLESGSLWTSQGPCILPLIQNIPPHPFESSTHFEIIAKFCRARPQTTVVYLREDFHMGFYGDLLTNVEQCIFLSLALRHKDFRHLMPNFDHSGVLTRPAMNWASSRCVELLKVPNLRFEGPPGGCEGLPDNLYYGPGGVGLEEAEIEELTEMIVEWDTNGI